MHDAYRVQVAHPDNDLSNDVRRLVFPELPILPNQLIQVLALDEFSDDVDMSLGLDALLEEDQ